MLCFYFYVYFHWHQIICLYKAKANTKYMKYFLFYPIVYIFTAVLTKDFNMSEAKCLKFKKIFC